MRTNQSKYGRRFDEEFKREVAVLASRPGATNEQVAQDLGGQPLEWVAVAAGGRAGTIRQHVASVLGRAGRAPQC